MCSLPPRGLPSVWRMRAETPELRSQGVDPEGEHGLLLLRWSDLALLSLIRVSCLVGHPGLGRQAVLSPCACEAWSCIGRCRVWRLTRTCIQSVPCYRCRWEPCLAGDFLLSTPAGCHHQVLNAWQVGLPGELCWKDRHPALWRWQVVRTEAPTGTRRVACSQLLSPAASSWVPTPASQPQTSGLPRPPRGVRGKGTHFQIAGIFPALTHSQAFTVAFSS